jgi:hypothetical protein
MTVNVWAVVGATPGYLPLTALIGTAGQILAMNSGATAAEWKNWKILSDQLYGPAGTVGAPSLAFEGDLTSGWYRPAANQWALSISNSQKFLATGSNFTFYNPITLSGKLLQEDQSSDISAAATTDLGTATGNYVVVTNTSGTTTITSFGGATIPAGTEIETKFSITGGSVSLTHNATSLILLGGSNIALQDKDVIRWRKINDASAYWEMVGFQRGLATSQITTKGGILVGTLSGGSIIPQEKTVPANGNIRFANSNDSTGWVDDTFRKKNAIINGDFNIWQRGTSFTSVTTNAYSADRWVYGVSGSAVHDISRSTDVPTVAEAGRLFNYSLLLDCTTADASIAAGDYSTIAQRIEGYNWLPLAQRAVTLSFWVKATKTGIYCASLTNGGFDRSCVKEYTINSADTWEKKTLTFPASPSAGTWDYTNGLGAQVIFAIAVGSTYQTTADSWQTGNYFATSSQVNGTDSTSNNFRLCGVQLEAGSVTTELEQRTFQEELALCQRYYLKTTDYGVVVTNNVGTLVGAIEGKGVTAGSDEPFAYWSFPTEMRTNPTVTLYTPGTGTTGQWGNPNAATTNARLGGGVSAGTRGTSIDNGGVAVASGTQCYIHAAAVAEI